MNVINRIRKQDEIDDMGKLRVKGEIYDLDTCNQILGSHDPPL